MKVYTDINSIKEINNPVVTTGTFDGVHVGHQKIISRIKEIAKKEKGETVIFTFFPHPRMVLYPDSHDLKLINTQEEKIELLEKSGIDHLIIFPFTKEFSRLSSVEFVRDILVNKIHTRKLVIGYNHHFGRNREGTFAHLKEYSHIYGFEVEEIPAQDIDDVKISSTKIREALLSGDIKTANTYLGYSFHLTGEVGEGAKRGRSIGFPTANLHVKEDYKIIPADGVYAIVAEYDSRLYAGMLNIGTRPTVDGKNKSIEAHLFDFDENIYHKKLKVFFKARIRDEKKFENMEELKKALQKDAVKAKQQLLKEPV